MLSVGPGHRWQLASIRCESPTPELPTQDRALSALLKKNEIKSTVGFPTPLETKVAIELSDQIQNLKNHNIFPLKKKIIKQLLSAEF